jgi:Uma2 family endonuclease
MLADSLRTHDEAPREDHFVVIPNATWADYQRFLELRGDHSVPRVAYLEGALQLMRPSRSHEALESMIGQLVEVWCLERGIEFSTFGSWTLESQQDDRAVEPDECYVFGDARGAERPHLAIEVIWTSGRLDKREIYRKLGVPELWFWRRGRILIYVLRGDAYEERAQSEVLPGIDLAELASFLDRPSSSRAILEYRAAIGARSRG